MARDRYAVGIDELSGDRAACFEPHLDHVRIAVRLDRHIAQEARAVAFRADVQVVDAGRGDRDPEGPLATNELFADRRLAGEVTHAGTEHADLAARRRLAVLLQHASRDRRATPRAQHDLIRRLVRFDGRRIARLDRLRVLPRFVDPVGQLGPGYIDGQLHDAVHVRPRPRELDLRGAGRAVRLERTVHDAERDLHVGERRVAAADRLGLRVFHAHEEGHRAWRRGRGRKCVLGEERVTRLRGALAPVRRIHTLRGSCWFELGRRVRFDGRRTLYREFVRRRVVGTDRPPREQREDDGRRQDQEAFRHAAAGSSRRQSKSVRRTSVVSADRISTSRSSVRRPSCSTTKR